MLGRGKLRAIINNTAASHLHFTALTVDNCATIMLAATPACAYRGEDEFTHTGHLPVRRGQVMKFDWKLTTVVYTRARVPAGPESTHTHEQDITMREISEREREGERGRGREGGTESIIGQNNGQPFRDNDELALDSAYMHYGIFSLSSERRFMKSGRINYRRDDCPETIRRNNNFARLNVELRKSLA